MAVPGIVIVLGMVTVLRIVTVTMSLELEQLTAVVGSGMCCYLIPTKECWLYK